MCFLRPRVAVGQALCASVEVQLRRSRVTSIAALRAELSLPASTSEEASTWGVDSAVAPGLWPRAAEGGGTAGAGAGEGEGAGAGAGEGEGEGEALLCDVLEWRLDAALRLLRQALRGAAPVWWPEAWPPSRQRVRAQGQQGFLGVLRRLRPRAFGEH